MTIGFDHVHIFTDDITTTVAFYKNVLNADEIRRVESEKGEFVHLAVGDARIVVSMSEKVGIPHFSVSVDNLDEFMNQLRQQGVEIETIGSVPGFKNAFIKDNNEILIELISPSTR